MVDQKKTKSSQRKSKYKQNITASVPLLVQETNVQSLRTSDTQITGRV